MTQDIPRCTAFHCCSVILDWVPASSCQDAPINTDPTPKSSLCRGHSRRVSVLSVPPHSSHTRTVPLDTMCSRSWTLKNNRVSPVACTLGWLVDLISSSCISRETSTGVYDVLGWKKFRCTTKTLREICLTQACSCKSYVSGTIISSHIPELPYNPKTILGTKLFRHSPLSRSIT